MRIRALARPVTLAAASLAVCLAATPAPAQDQDPAVATIDGLDKALIDTMKSAQDLGVRGRYDRIKPAVQRTFNLPAMARFAVGSKWNEFSDADHDTLTDAFTRLTVASYAHNFDGFGGEHFEINPTVQTRGPDKIVQTKLVRPNDKPVALNYRMRQDGGTWKVIDVYYGNISQLSIRRADLTAAAMTGGAKALAKNMNGQADKLLK